jgi:hypothetical protein
MVLARNLGNIICEDPVPADFARKLESETVSLSLRVQKLEKALTWIAERGWNPHGTTIENAHLAYDCHCVAAQALSPLKTQTTLSSVAPSIPTRKHSTPYRS